MALGLEASQLLELRGDGRRGLGKPLGPLPLQLVQQGVLVLAGVCQGRKFGGIGCLRPKPLPLFVSAHLGRMSLGEFALRLLLEAVQLAPRAAGHPARAPQPHR